MSRDREPGFFDALAGVVTVGLMGWAAWEVGKRVYGAYEFSLALEHERTLELEQRRHEYRMEKLRLELRALELHVDVKKAEAEKYKQLTHNGSGSNDTHSREYGEARAAEQLPGEFSG